MGRISGSIKLDQNVEKTIRQAIRHVALLRKSWEDVLPENVLANTIGYLIDGLTNTLVAQVIAAEDISSRTAAELVQVFQVTETKLVALLSVSVQRKFPQVLAWYFPIRKFIRKVVLNFINLRKNICIW